MLGDDLSNISVYIYDAEDNFSCKESMWGLNVKFWSIITPKMWLGLVGLRVDC